MVQRRIGLVWCVCLILSFLFLLSCSKSHKPPAPPGPPGPPGLKSQKPYRINGIWYYPLPSAEGYSEEGRASWYGSYFHGKPTACGEPYDMWAQTAAHKTLPLGTYVKVTNLQNGKSTVLRINDRGPFVSGRIIDLSCRGAQDLDCYRKGLAKVRVEAVQYASEYKVGQDTFWKPTPVPSFRYGRFMIQIGAFRDQGNAQRLRERMKGKYRDTAITHTERNGLFYRVQVGAYEDILAAKEEMERLRTRGFPDAFVIAVEGK